MKAIILAGGYAKRLWPLTLTQSKALLRVGNRPVIEYIIEKLDSTSVNEIIISTNKKFEKDFQQWIGKNNGKYKKPIKLFVEPSTSEENKYGVIKAIEYMIEIMKIDEDIIIVAGDNLFDFDMNRFVNFYHQKKEFIVAIYDIENREKAKMYGVVNIDDRERIIQFLEKPDVPTSSLVSTGCYLFPKDMFHLVSQYISDGNNKDAPGHFLQWLYKRIPMFAFRFDGHWFDIGDKEVLKQAEKWSKDFSNI